MSSSPFTAHLPPRRPCLRQRLPDYCINRARGYSCPSAQVPNHPNQRRDCERLGCDPCLATARVDGPLPFSFSPIQVTWDLGWRSLAREPTCRHVSQTPARIRQPHLQPLRSIAARRQRGWNPQERVRSADMFGGAKGEVPVYSPVKRLTRKLITAGLVGSFAFAALPAADTMYCEHEIETLRAWIEGGKKSNSEQVTDKDREKMRELEREPRVQQAIEDSFVCLRENHQQQAYRYNVGKGPNQIYDNPILQEHVNQLGQSLVPDESSNLYTFRIVYDPLPDSFALSTGSIYVTTGMLSMLDNEAQLAYVLSHEIAHVEREHFYKTMQAQIVEEAYNIQRQRAGMKKAAIFSAVGAAVGSVAGGATQGWGGAARFGALGAMGGFTVGAYRAATAKPKSVKWEEARERDADEFALRRALERNYDVREAPKLLASMEQNVRRDPRTGFGFHGSKANIDTRKQHLQTLLQGAMKTELEAKSELTGTSPDFGVLMATLKRDNGILALQYDLFQMAKTNLEQSNALRSGDATANFYLGRVYRLTAGSDQDRREAQRYFQSAIDLDAQRGVLPQAHLELALLRIQEQDSEAYPQVQKSLKTYVSLYQRQNAGALPPNMYAIYDYMAMTGDQSWSVAGVINVAHTEPTYASTQ